MAYGVDVVAKGQNIDEKFSEAVSPQIGLRLGYKLNIFDLITSSYFKVSTGVSSESQLGSLELGVDIGYKFKNPYAMRAADPAIYGF